MTTTLHTVPPAGAPGRPVGRVGLPVPRLIGVGVRDHRHEAAVLAWAGADALPRTDALHVVHAYVPLRLEGCAWEPVSRARDARHLAAKRVVGQSVQRANAAHEMLRVAGSAVAGLARDVLVELSDVVDLIAIGDDAGARGPEARIGWWIQDHARCPVVCVPAGYHLPGDVRPVTVVVGETGLDDAVMRFGAAAARRHGVGLQVSRTWESLHEGTDPGPVWLAHQQEELDAQLAGWRSVLAGLPVSARIELDPGWPDRLRAGSSLLVVARRAVDPLRSSVPARPGDCPIVTVPEVLVASLLT